MDLIRVGNLLLDQILVQIRPMILDSLQYANEEITWGGLIEKLQSGSFDLWVLWDRQNESFHGFIVTGFVELPERLAVDVIAMSSNAPREIWMEHLKTIEDYALSMGATELVIEGRRGWLKVLDKVGFEPVSVKMVKRLNS